VVNVSEAAGTAITILAAKPNSVAVNFFREKYVDEIHIKEVSIKQKRESLLIPFKAVWTRLPVQRDNYLLCLEIKFSIKLRLFLFLICRSLFKASDLE